jgi:hypothetical protein
MGYSGLGIINGDYPMDMIHNIMTMIDAEQDEDTGEFSVKDGDTIAERLTKRQDELLAHCKKDGSSAWKKKYGEQYIATLVLGTVMVRNGASINAKTMKALINACDKDPWGKNELERRIYLEDFKEILSAYDNKTPTKEWKENGKEFGVDFDEMCRRNFSQKVVKMARHYLMKFYGDKEWFGGLTTIFNGNGYALLIGVKFDDKRTPQNAAEVLKGLFDVPLYIIDANELKLEETKTTTK